MKMLTLVCGEKIEEEIVFLRSEVADKLGTIFGTGTWTDCNKLYLIALEDAYIRPHNVALRLLTTSSRCQEEFDKGIRDTEATPEQARMSLLRDGERILSSVHDLRQQTSTKPQCRIASSTCIS